MVHKSRLSLSLFAIATALWLGIVLVPAPALADRIDGFWCRAAKQLMIEGPRIVTPGGKDMQGDYDRHAFRYVVPAGEPDAGAEVSMTLLNEDLVQLVFSTRPNDTQDWQRCTGRIS